MKHTLYQNYGSGATDILEGDLTECVDMYFNLLKTVEEQKVWEMYLVHLGVMNHENFISFEKYKNDILYPNKFKSSENVVSDGRTDAELEAMADSIIFGGSLEAREINIKSRR